MNRIEHLTQSWSAHFAGSEVGHDSARSPIQLNRLGVACDSACRTFFAPLHYEAGYAYPLVVWLHGPCDDEQQLKRIMPLVSMRNYVAVAPRGTIADESDTCEGGYSWQQSEDHIVLASQRVLASIEAAQAKFHIAPSRIFVAGFGCGGTMALRIAMHQPDRFAGALALGGPFPRGYRPLQHLNEVRGLPLFLASGAHSKLYPESQVCQDLRLFHSAGMSISLRQYPCGDELTSLMLSDMNRWIMEQICPACPSCPSEIDRSAGSAD